MSQPIRVGIVGGSTERGWALDAHLPALAKQPQFTISAVSARTLETAERARAAFGAQRAFGDSLALARDPGVDLVAVTVKVPEHRAVALAALDAGKHVYCEWPLGRDVAEAEEMAAAVKPQSHAMIGLQGLFASAVTQAAKLVAEGAIGAPRVLRVFASAGAWGRATEPFYAYLQDKRTGATLETIGGGHTLATMEALGGSYEEVDARNTTFRKRVPVIGTTDTVDRTCADHMLVLGRHVSGCVSTLELMGGSTSRPNEFELMGETGWLRVVGTVPGASQIARLRLEASFPLPPASEEIAADLTGAPVNVAKAYAAFARDIRSGTRTVPDFDRAVRLTRLIATIDRASETGRRQTV